MPKTWGFLLAVTASLIALPALAHGPSRQKVTETVDIAAPPDKIWAVIGNFHDLSWNPNVAKTAGDGGNTIGSFRQITLKAGGELDEDLEKYDPAGLRYSTFLPHNDPKMLPVTNFSTELSVTAGEGGKSTVEWRGAFYRGDPNNDPPPELNDDAAIKAVHAYLAAGLAGLKKKMEGGS